MSDLNVRFQAYGSNDFLRMEFTMDAAEVAARLGRLQKDTNLAIARTANRMRPTAIKFLAQGTVDRYDIRKRDVTDSISKKGNATRNSPYVKLIFTGVHKNLLDIRSWHGHNVVSPTAENRNGIPKFIKAHVLKGKAGVPLMKSPRPFVRTAKTSGHKAVFVKSPMDIGGIRGAAVPAVPQEVGNEEVFAKFASQFGAKMRDRLEHEIQYIIERG